ncbi:hypothetical protein V8F06_002157 [Rhypophila decipiens]
MIVVIGALLHGQHSQVSLLLLLVLYRVPAPDSDVDGIITHVKCEHPMEIGRPKLEQARGMYFLVSPIFDPVRTRSDGSTRHAMGRVCRGIRSLQGSRQPCWVLSPAYIYCYCSGQKLLAACSWPASASASACHIRTKNQLCVSAARADSPLMPCAQAVEKSLPLAQSHSQPWLIFRVQTHVYFHRCQIQALLPELPLKALPINYGRNAILGRRLRQIKVWLAGAAGIRESKIMCWPFFVGAQGPVCFWAWRDENKTKGGVMKRENR